jgi:phosphate starvation-inducible PhoH-like protein
VRDALVEGLGSGHVDYLVGKELIVIKPLEFIRGSTIKNAWLIGDEMQNATRAQTKLLLTRIGENAKFILNGDPDQCDLPKLSDSGLMDAVNRLKRLSAVGVVEFTESDIVRSGLCREIVIAYMKKNDPAITPESVRYNHSETESDDDGLKRMLRA